MTFSYAKTIAALTIMTTACFGSAAHAADAFNKFPQAPAAAQPAPQATAPQAATPKVTTYTVQTAATTQGFAKTRRVNRVVEPVTTGAAYAPTPDSSSMAKVFNKMVTQSDTTSREMPVLNKRAVFTR